MNASADTRSRNLVGELAIGALWWTWQLARWPVLALLIILEPFVRVVLSGFALIVTLTAFFFEFATTRPFPFFGVLSVGLGAFGLLVLYEWLISALSG